MLIGARAIAAEGQKQMVPTDGQHCGANFCFFFVNIFSLKGLAEIDWFSNKYEHRGPNSQHPGTDVYCRRMGRSGKIKGYKL